MSTPTDSPPGMSERQVRVLEAIPRGRQHARTSGEIADEVEIRSGDATHHAVREIIRELIYDHERPICSCNNGYFTPATDLELQEYLEELRSRKRGIQSRIKALRSAYHSDDVGGQHQLF